MRSAWDVANAALFLASDGLHGMIVPRGLIA
jgi:hypothetical protein